MTRTFQTIWLPCLVAMAAGIATVAQAEAPETPARVVVLGFDGMDYRLTRQWITAGTLPHLARLAEEGTFRPLQTTNPPLSPVAWSTFITGMDPGGHGVFDFLRRDPRNVRDGFLPEDAVTAVQSASRRRPWTIPGTDYVLPPTQRHVLLRQGSPFWHLLEAAGVPTMTYKMPASFPASEEPGRVLAGMGVPDVAGTYGSFTYLTTRPEDAPAEVSGGRVLEAVVTEGVVQVREGKQLTRPALRGPVNPFRTSTEGRQTQVAFDAYVDPQARTGVVVLQQQPVVLKEGEWSRWMDVEFDLLPLAASVRGIVRFYLQEAAPGFRLFATPIHLAPGSEGLASSGFDLELARALGHFHTKGMPQETGAFTQGILSAEEYIVHSRLMHEETLAAMDRLLAEHPSGLLFVYFSTLDMDSHVLWNHFDTEHPAHDPALAEQHGRHILDLYRELDRIVGQTLAALDSADQLYVISDHGFVSLRREFNLTTWLAEEGYLTYRHGFDGAKSSFFEGVDWSRTRAYGVGFNGLYVNRQGREPHGPVTNRQFEPLVEEIRRKLLALDDRGRQVFEHVYRPKDIYSGVQLDQAPDLILAYRPPFGPSDDSVLGTPSTTVFADRLRGFTGHHTTDASFVPGVLLSTRQFRAEEPRLEDVTATLLSEFEVPPAPAMTGRTLE